MSRLLCGFLLLVGVGCGASRDGDGIQKAEVQQDELHRAKAAFADIGGEYLAKNPVTGQPGHAFLLPHGAGDGALAKVPNLPFTFGLDLERVGVTDAGLPHLARLRNLSALKLSRGVTDEGMPHLAALPNLRELSLFDARIDNDGLKSLSSLKNLTGLVLGKGVTECVRTEDGRRVNLEALNRPWSTEAGLKELAALKNLEYLSLYNVGMTDAALKELSGLTRLTTLSLGYARVTDAGLKTIAQFVKLRELLIESGGVTDAGLKELAGLKHLTTLDLLGTSWTPAGLRHLAPLTKLTTLDLGLMVTDETLRTLREIGLLHALALMKGKTGGRPASSAEVESLSLSGTKVTNDGLKELAELKSLTTLDLGSTSVTDAGLQDLAALQRLTNLDLAFTKVTDAGLQKLSAFKNLRQLKLGDTKTTAAGRQRLQEALPKCWIE